jgi:hypothetical protein
MSIVWSRAAITDWRRLSLADAEVVVRGVERWNRVGEGLVHAAGASEYRLFVGAHVVVFYLDAANMHIAQVRQA